MLLAFVHRGMTAGDEVGVGVKRLRCKGQTRRPLHRAACHRRPAGKPIPLYERDKRIHGLKPFQQLVDAAPAGSVLKPPPGIYAGPVVSTSR